MPKHTVVKRRYRSTSRNFNDPLYKAWRTKVYKRDSYKCQWPKCRCHTRLNAHHIRRWANYPTLRFEVNNGITLCYKHHKFINKKEDDFVLFFLQLLQRKLK